MGVIAHVIKKSVWNSGSDGSYLTLRDLATLLSQLPENTTIVGIKTLPVVALSMYFEIKLHNKIFKDGATLTEATELYTRQIGFTEAGEVVEFNASPLYNVSEVVKTSR